MIEQIKRRIQIWYCNRGWSCKHCPFKCTTISWEQFVKRVGNEKVKSKW